MSEPTTYATSNRTKYILVAVIVVLAFAAAYGIAAKSSGTLGAQSVSTAAPAVTPVAAGGSCDPATEGSGGCGSEGGSCCGGESVTVQGATAVEGDVQRIYVDVSAGYFDPNVISVTAGMPTEITFSEGTGCMAEVMFKDFNVFESLTGGGTTIMLPALEAGEYGFSCGMEMVFGTLVVS